MKKNDESNKEEKDPKKEIVEKVPNLPRKKGGKMSKVPPKFRWWQDDLKFDQYYKPLADTHIP
jgi:hypothetical protein